MFEEYLRETKYMNYSDPLVKAKADELMKMSHNDIELIRNTYNFVRDEIKHSWDAKDHRVTVTASDVLREGVGICWAKANLLAALLRANNVPSGFSYQKLTLGDTPDTGYCIHALNTVYVPSMVKWIRLDARGNNENVHAEFSLEEEKLAFEIKSEGEVDFYNNLADPAPNLMRILETSTDALHMYLNNLPAQLDR